MHKNHTRRGAHRPAYGRPSPAELGAKLPSARHPRTVPFEVIRQRIAGGAR